MQGPSSNRIVSVRPRLHDLPRERLSIILTEHACAPQVPMRRQRNVQPVRQWHVPQTPTLGRRHVSVPVGPAHAHLTVGQVHVTPLQRNHLAAPQPRFAAEQDNQMRPRVESSRRVDKPLVRVEIVIRRIESRGRAAR
jgi:hypothetical protein